MRKINFIGGFLVGALGSIWTLFIFVVGIICGILMNIDKPTKPEVVQNPWRKVH